MLLIYILAVYYSFGEVTATICYECPDVKNLSSCYLFNSQLYGNLGCLIEFQNIDDNNQLEISRITKFCPTTINECNVVNDEKDVWLTIAWKMRNNKDFTLRKNPIEKMWYECFTDKCNDPTYIASLLSTKVTWNTALLMKEPKHSKLNSCLSCSKQTSEYNCEIKANCNQKNNICKMQGYLLNANPVGSRIITLNDVRYWQSKCDELNLTQADQMFSINGYMINNLSKKKRNIAIEAYCLYDECNSLDKIGKLAETVKVELIEEPWFPINNTSKNMLINIQLIIILIILINLIE